VNHRAAEEYSQQNDEDDGADECGNDSVGHERAGGQRDSDEAREPAAQKRQHAQQRPIAERRPGLTPTDCLQPFHIALSIWS
jgi:hypothetical protein